MKSIDELKETPNLSVNGRIKDSRLNKYNVYEGWVEWPGFKGSVCFGYDEGIDGCMEHVSVSSFKKRQLPTWDDMCKLKDMFFYPDEMVVQIHPKEERYVHSVGLGKRKLENVLHLWRPKDGDFSALNHPEKWD